MRRLCTALSLVLVLHLSFGPAAGFAATPPAPKAAPVHSPHEDERPVPVLVIIAVKYVVVPLAVGLAANYIWAQVTQRCAATIEVMVNEDVGSEDATCNTRGCTARTDLESERDPDNIFADYSWAQGRAVTKDVDEGTATRASFEVEDLKAGVFAGHSFRFNGIHDWQGTAYKGTIGGDAGVGQPDTVTARIDELIVTVTDSTLIGTDSCDLFADPMSLRFRSDLDARRHGDGSVVLDATMIDCELVLGPPDDCGVGAPPTILSNPCGLGFSFLPVDAGYQLVFHPYESAPIELLGWAEGDTLDLDTDGSEFTFAIDRPGDPEYVGACCLSFGSGDCELRSASECPPEVGAYLGDETSCDPNPCNAAGQPELQAAGWVTTVTVAGNPARGRLALRLESRERGECQAVLVDVNGREVGRSPRRILGAAGRLDLEIDVRGIPSGAYYVRIEGDLGPAPVRPVTVLR